MATDKVSTYAIPFDTLNEWDPLELSDPYLVPEN